MVETAMGGKAASQVIQGERQFDLLVRMQEPYRKDADAIRNLLIATPDGQHLPLSQFADISVKMAFRSFVGSRIRAISGCSSAFATGIWRARWRRRAARRTVK